MHSTHFLCHGIHVDDSMIAADPGYGVDCRLVYVDVSKDKMLFDGNKSDVL